MVSAQMAIGPSGNDRKPDGLRHTHARWDLTQTAPPVYREVARPPVGGQLLAAGVHLCRCGDWCGGARAAFCCGHRRAGPTPGRQQSWRVGGTAPQKDRRGFTRVRPDQKCRSILSKSAPFRAAAKFSTKSRRPLQAPRGPWYPCVVKLASMSLSPARPCALDKTLRCKPASPLGAKTNHPNSAPAGWTHAVP